MVAIRPDQDPSERAPARPGAVLRPHAENPAENQEAYRRAPVIPPPAEGTAEGQGAYRRAPVIPPPADVPGIAEAGSGRARRAAGPARMILVPVGVACVLALVAAVMGAILLEGTDTDSATPGLRPVTEPTEASDADVGGDQADGAGAEAGQEGSSGAGDAAADDGQGAGTVSQERLFDAPPAQSDSESAAQFSETGPLDGAYPAPPVAEEPVVAVAKMVAPSVVRIEIGSAVGLDGVGSGIVWDADNGYIVTNQHVVEGVDEVTVRLFDGSDIVGEVIGGSSSHDVAVVRVDPGDAELAQANFAPGSSVRVGQLAVAIGSPFGLTGTVTAGIVSAVRIHGGGGSDPDFPVPVEMIQTDASINRGNSGGALVDWQGRVIGMNTFIQTTSGGSIGLGFAIPGDTVALIATRVVNGESLELGYIGISSSGGHVDAQGVPVTEVVQDSPADEAGLQPGDVILSMDGRALNNISELAAAVKLHSPGEAVELEIQRDGDLYIATVVLGTWQ